MKSFCLYARWLWTASKGTRTSLFLCGLLRLLHTGVSFYFIYVCKTLVDIASGVSTLDFRRYTWQLAGCVVLQLILSNGRSYLSARNDVRLQNYLRGRIFSRLAGMDYESRLRYHSGDIQGRLTEDVRVVANMLGHSLPSFAATLIQLSLALVFLSSLDIRLVWLLVT
ncbi:ABC transporter ATP-binding protein, partial [Akkermansia sp. BIOML-A63]